MFSFLAASRRRRRFLVEVDGVVEAAGSVGILLVMFKTSRRFRFHPSFSRWSSIVVKVANVLAKNPYLKKWGNEWMKWMRKGFCINGFINGDQEKGKTRGGGWKRGKSTYGLSRSCQGSRDRRCKGSRGSCQLIVRGGSICDLLVNPSDEVLEGCS